MPRFDTSGQSLIEVLVAVAVGAILFAGSAALIVPNLQIGKSSDQIQVGAALGREMVDNVRVWSESDWHNVLALATGSANTYFLMASSSPFTVSTGTEPLMIGTTTYTRFFYLDDVYRDANGNVTSTAAGNAYDPSTKRVSVIYGWLRGVTTTLITYLTRNRTDVLDQTDWSGGPGWNGPAASPDARFSVSTNINSTGTPGTIFTVPPSNVYPNGYAYRSTITASSSLVAPSGTSLSDFPMLVSGTSSYLAASSSGGYLQDPNGYDIIFTSDAAGMDQLAYERDNYSSSTGAFTFWVKVPTLSSSSNVIYMFYDNAVTSDESKPDPSEPTSVWDSYYKGVWHLEENNMSVGKVLRDVSSNGLSLVTDGSNPSATSSGVINGALNLPNLSGGTPNQYYPSYASSSLDSGLGTGVNVTLEAWIKIPVATYYDAGYNALLGRITSYPNDTIAFFSPSYDTGIAFGLGGLSNSAGTGYVPISLNTWYDVVGTYDGTTVDLYLNGSLSTSTLSSNSSFAADAPFWINDLPYAGARGTDEVVDEVRISDTTRSADWISTEYSNESNPAGFLTIGAPTQYNVATMDNISTSSADHWAWNDTLGWIDFGASSTNVQVSGSSLTGYASSSAGDISLDCSTTRNGNICGTSSYHVLNDGSGNLSGWAWNDAYGWISFCGGQGTTNCPGSTSYQVTIDSGGNFQAWAWNDALGWIDFNCDNNATCGTSNFEVATTWRASSLASIGQLDSAIFDTGVASGAQFNAILWQGSQIAGSTVQFQLAVSNASSGPWIYLGPDGTSNTYFTPEGSGDAVSLGDTLFNNYRYFRYRIFITYANGSSSRINDVIINWSP